MEHKHLIRSTTKYAWLVITISIIAFIAMALYGRGAVASLTNDISDLIPGTQSDTVDKTITQKFPTRTTDAIIVFSGTGHNKATDPGFELAVQNEVKKIKNVSAAQGYFDTRSPLFISGDQTKTYAALTMAGSDDDKYRALDDFRKSKHNDKFTVTVGGSIVSRHDAMQQVSHDLKLGEMISLPILAVALLFVFRGVIAAALPLVLGLFAIVGGLSVLRVLAHFTNIDQYSVNVVTLLGLGLAVDYSLLMVGRFREELEAQPTVAAAVHKTFVTAGRTIFFSGLTVIVSLLSLLFFPITLLRSIGLGGASAVLIALIAALAILPALLMVLGRGVNRLSIRRPHHEGRQSNFWGAIAAQVTKRPVLFILGALAVVTVLSWPLLHIKFVAKDYRTLPAGTPGRIVAETLATDFNQKTGPIVVLVDGHNPAVIERDISKMPGVTSLRETGRNGNLTQLSVSYDGAVSEPTAQTLVKDIRALSVPGYSIQTGGLPAIQYDLIATIKQALPWALGAIALTIFIVLSLLLKSLVLPLQAIAINSLSLLAAIGIIVWVFQEGHFTSSYWLANTGGLDVTTPVLIFAIAFGLSMDYAVFLYSRIQEEHQEGKATVPAIIQGVQLTGPIITEAATLFFIVVMAFATSKIPMLQQIGIGMGLAVIIDAFFVRIILVPATMKLLGRLNWLNIHP